MNILTLGESLARMSTFDGHRLADASQLNLTFGGAESNVAINLAQLGHNTTYATKLPDNSLSKNIISILKANDVKTNNITFGPGRLGTYFVEGGSGVRPSQVTYDRFASTFSLIENLEWDLDELFDNVDIFHMTGITLALSEQWRYLGVELIHEAHERGIDISFDMNYRSTLWDTEAAKKTYQELLPYISYLSASKLDAIAFMDIEEASEKTNDEYIAEIAEKYPNLKLVFGTNRTNKAANQFFYEGFVYNPKENHIVKSKNYDLDIVIDRIGAGDSYTAGILDGVILNKDTQSTVDFATAAAVLKHTIRGDINRFNRNEIDNFITNSQNVIR